MNQPIDIKEEKNKNKWELFIGFVQKLKGKKGNMNDFGSTMPK